MFLTVITQTSFATVLEREKVDRWYNSRGFIHHVENCLSFAKRKFYIEHITKVFKRHSLPKETRDYVYKFAAMMRHIREVKQRKELAKNE